MDELFSQEVSTREGEELMTFLLDTMPLYRRVTETNDLYELQALMDEFCFKYRHDGTTACAPRSRSHQPEVTMLGCDFCNSPVVCIDTELACLV